MENEIDLLQLYHILMRRKWIIIFITLIAVIISAIFSFFVVQPVYEANVNIIIGKEEAQYFLEDKYTNSDIALYLQVAKTYEEIAKSRAVRYRTEQAVQDGSFEQVKNIKVASKSSTQVLTITISHFSAEAAAVCANALAENFIQVAGEVLPAGQLKILDKAERPEQPSSPNRKLNIAIGSVLGMMISIGIVMLLEFINRSIESEQDVKNYLNLPVLGVVPQ
ncbi:Wzz/FepE/Etk N-terminal domain-containing protein [Petroclostridium sp. X23]|uniref:YveK family protein n=1 Tax=Petroclostridium sp. X23 TaxID=3045146 RepID=UPI0024ACD687|nr:Wzz/FepE/Etk N-terminal domain-containing protein [Petroclostridium sp. X23]WHH57514.1 Wzz/FepE/Etk N-terminal domain-containing protein [Petroclostridium sp. X23]